MKESAIIVVKVSLKCLTRSHVKPEEEEVVEPMQSDFWRNVVKMLAGCGQENNNVRYIT